MLGPDFMGLPAILVTAFLPKPVGALAYGPGPPVDLIPYFLGLAAWAGFAVVAIVLSSLTALLRRLRRKRNHETHEKKPTSQMDEQSSSR